MAQQSLIVKTITADHNGRLSVAREISACWWLGKAVSCEIQRTARPCHRNGADDKGTGSDIEGGGKAESWMENRHGIIVNAMVTQADGKADVMASLMLSRK